VDPDLEIPLGSYRFDRYGIRLETSNARPVRAIVEAIFGTFYSGKLRQLNGTLELRPSRHLFVSLEYEQNDGSLSEGDFAQRLARAKLDLSLTPEISWTNVVQYDNTTDRMGMSSIFRWEIQPGDEFFVVFDQSWDGEGSSFECARRQGGVDLPVLNRRSRPFRLESTPSDRSGPQARPGRR
jgi:hypothetical protein